MPTPSARSEKKKTKTFKPDMDAVQLLKADHREATEVFEQFEKARSGAKKAELANKVCKALRVHMVIEEEIFYPAFLEATGDEDLDKEALVEHQAARDLMDEIEKMEPDDEFFDAKVKVLSEMIAHHIKEEEKPSTGMFAEAKASDMDLDDLGARLAARKEELMAQ